MEPRLHRVSVFATGCRNRPIRIILQYSEPEFCFFCFSPRYLSILIERAKKTFSIQISLREFGSRYRYGFAEFYFPIPNNRARFRNAVSRATSNVVRFQLYSPGGILVCQPFLLLLLGFRQLLHLGPRFFQLRPVIWVSIKTYITNWWRG